MTIIEYDDGHLTEVSERAGVKERIANRLCLGKEVKYVWEIVAESVLGSIALDYMGIAEFWRRQYAL